VGTKLAPGDIVIVLGHQDDLPQLARKFAAGAKKMTFRGVTIEPG
jgi:voltage-gated potassium channel